MAELPELPAHLRQAFAQRIADHYSLPADEATAMLDDVIAQGRDSAHVERVWQVLGSTVRPIIDEILAVMKTPDPYSQEAAERVVAVAKATIPELGNPPTA